MKPKTKSGNGHTNGTAVASAPPAVEKPPGDTVALTGPDRDEIARLDTAFGEALRLLGKARLDVLQGAPGINEAPVAIAAHQAHQRLLARIRELAGQYGANLGPTSTETWNFNPEAMTFTRMTPPAAARG